VQKYNQALELCSRAAFEEVMSRRQKNTWDFKTQIVIAVYAVFHRLCRPIGRFFRV